MEPWALRLIDATAKYPTGLLQGTTADIGAYDECIETVVNDKYGHQMLRGQFCNFHVQMSESASVVEEMVPALMYSHPRAKNVMSYMTDPRLSGFRLGVCVVDDCNEKDLQSIVDIMTGNLAKVTVKNCVTNKYRGMNQTEAAIIGVLGVIAALMVIGTTIELYVSQKCPHRHHSALMECLTSFSVVTNTKIILASNKDKRSDTYPYRFIHGIRFLSILWIVLGHSYGTIMDTMSRMANALLYFDHWETVIVTAGFQCVDTFFFFSGFLLYYALNKQRKNRAIVAVIAVVRRYIRATVPLFFLIMCMYLLPLIASGPDSKEFYAMFYAEINKHWWDLLLQVRNWRKDIAFTTLPHLWYLSADFQFFLLSVIVIQVLKNKKWWTAFMFAALSLVFCGTSAWQVYGNDITPFMVSGVNSLSTLLNTGNNYYMLPFYHGVCFFSGCITFILVERYRERKVSRILLAGMWGIGLSSGLYCLFMKSEWYSGDLSPSELSKIFYAFTDRIFWSISVAWITFACSTGRGGILNQFLSWEGFVPLSRLSFGVYLIHYPFFILKYHIARERTFFSHFSLVSQWFSVLVWSYLLSYLMFVACDAPTGRLEKLLFMRQRATPKKEVLGNDAHHDVDDKRQVDSYLPDSSGSLKIDLQVVNGQANPDATSKL